MSKNFKYTNYFLNEVIRKRPYIKKEWCEFIVLHYIHKEIQFDKRLKFWGYVPEFDNKILRVVTLADEETIHNAFPDRNFKKEFER